LIITHALADARNDGLAGVNNDGNITAAQFIQGEISNLPCDQLQPRGRGCT